VQSNNRRKIAMLAFGFVDDIDYISKQQIKEKQKKNNNTKHNKE